MFLTKYNKSTGQFLGIIETVGQIIVRGDEGKTFFDCGYCQKNSKLLYSTRNRKIPNSLGAGMFPSCKTMHERRKLSPDFSRIFYYLPPTTDRSKNINKYMGQVYLKPMDVELGEFGAGFDPSVLDNRDDPERKSAREAVIKVMKKVVEIGGNFSLKQNADALLCKLSTDKNILWPGERIPEGKFVLTY